MQFGKLLNEGNRLVFLEYCIGTVASGNGMKEIKTPATKEQQRLNSFEEMGRVDVNVVPSNVKACYELSEAFKDLDSQVQKTHANR